MLEYLLSLLLLLQPLPLLLLVLAKGSLQVLFVQHLRHLQDGAGQMVDLLALLLGDHGRVGAGGVALVAGLGGSGAALEIEIGQLRKK